ncbi:MAG: molecular chaperone DnaJ [Alphaproteobacteria bacterium]|nr:molecular chaperone DnaJ [Alphaproteobacteria bacterium]
MEKKDFYEQLNVDRGASLDEIKRAYRVLAKKYHPDMNPGDKEAEIHFREVSEAYEILKDSEKRAAYDQYGFRAFEQNSSGFGSGFGGFGAGGFNSSSFADLFEEMFSGFGGGASSRGSSRPSRGSDIRYDLEISLLEAFQGVKKTIEITVQEVCKTCKGKGGKNVKTCSTCGGSGRVRYQQGFFMVENECPKCHGTGKEIKDICPDCHGAGVISRTKKLEINIPAGVDTGVRMRLEGEGHAAASTGKKGDLYVFISVKEHKIFKRQRENLYCEKPISMALASMGGSFKMEMLDGSFQEVSVAEGTSFGDKVVLKGLGMPILHSKQKGNLYVILKVETPQNLTDEQKELLERFAEIEAEKQESVWENIKLFSKNFAKKVNTKLKS